MKWNTLPLHLRYAKCTRTPCAKQHLVWVWLQRSRSCFAEANVLLQFSEDDSWWGEGRDAIILPIKSDTKIDIVFGGWGAVVRWIIRPVYMRSHLLYAHNSLSHIRSNRVSAESGRCPKKHAASSFPRCVRTTFSTVQNALGCAARRRRPVDTPWVTSVIFYFHDSRALVTIIAIVINTTTHTLYMTSGG